MLNYYLVLGSNNFFEIYESKAKMINNKNNKMSSLMQKKNQFL